MKQGSKEWRAARVGRLTASNAGAALGRNPWRTPDDLIRQMVREYHGAEPEFTGNVATEYGSAHEPIALAKYCDLTGNPIDEAGFFVHPEHQYLGASPDGLIGLDGMIEIKCPYGLRNDPNPAFKMIIDQPHYYDQAQMQLHCAGRDWCDFFQWSQHGSNLGRVFISERWWDENFPKLAAFYERYREEINNPVHLEPKRKPITSQRALALLDEYEENMASIDAAAARNKEILSELVELAGEKNAVIGSRKLTRVERKGNVQYAKVPELKGVDLEPYRGKPSVYWKLG